MASSGGTKTEKPSAQRLQKARKEGQFVASAAMVGAVQFLTFTALLGGLVSDGTGHLRILLSRLLDRAMSSEIGPAEWPGLIGSVAKECAIPLLKVMGIVLTASLVTHLGITRLGFSFQRLTPKFDRLNPFSRLKGLPAQNSIAVVQAVCLLGIMAAVMNAFFGAEGPGLLRLPLQGISAAAAEVGDAVQMLFWKAAAVFLLFGAVDLFRQYRKHNEAMRMSKEEVKEENKRNEGDPQMKARIRRLRRDLLRRQMMREVPKATAVIVNPTHFAVAIRYESDTMASPVVTAKGRNWLALRIRQIAVENQVPVVENPPLARALYDAIEVGRAISPAFYRAIAEILAYVYRLMGRNLQG